MISRLFLGRLSARLGRRALLVGSVALSAVGLAVAVVPMPLWALAVVVVALGFGLGAGQPLTMSWLAESTPPGLRGRAMSLRLTGNRVGQVVVPSAAGLLAAGAGAGGVLALTAAGLAAAGVAARRIESPPPPDHAS
jgi:MFS family permease